AFGLLANQTWFFVAVAVLLIAAVVFAGRRLTGGNRLLQAALAVMLSGALGNLIDRVTRDHRVVDFFELPHWPVFNVADMALLTGVGLYLYGTLRLMAAERREGPDR
ncbi:MAG: signal peptidase II, partial [Chloroflexota bacterium]